jgi:hypothetical protein
MSEARAKASIAATAPRRARPQAPIYTIKLRGRSSGPDDIRSLRAILKTLLRRHRLRCVSVSEEGAA